MRLLSIAILFCCLSCIGITAFGQHEFYVKGEVDHINDGEVVALFRYRDGSIDAASTDTIHNGKFLFRDTASQPTLYWILGQGDNFSRYPLEIWAAPGITITISGKGYGLRTWDVKSSLHNQLEENQLLAPSVADWNKVQELEIQRKQMLRALQHSTGAEKDSLASIRDHLSRQMDSVMENITRTQIELLQTLAVTDIWLTKMYNLSFGSMLYHKTSVHDSLLQLYKRIPDKQRTSPIGEKITAALFPPPVVKDGEAMADMPLLDTQMAVHKLAEYKSRGKYLLLDFWFINCGPCELAIPETIALQDSLINKLSIVSINVDETAYWKANLKGKQISRINLNDGKGRLGLANWYGVIGYPHYVVISPEGIVIGAWTGYEKGELTQKVTQILLHHSHQK